MVLVFIRHIYCIHMLFVVSCKKKKFFFRLFSLQSCVCFFFLLHFIFVCLPFIQRFFSCALVRVFVHAFHMKCLRYNCIKRRQRRAKLAQTVPTQQRAATHHTAHTHTHTRGIFGSDFFFFCFLLQCVKRMYATVMLKFKFFIYSYSHCVNSPRFF